MDKLNNEEIEKLMELYQQDVDSVDIVNTYDITEDQFFWFKMGVVAGRTDGKLALIKIAYSDKMDKEG